MKRFSAFFLCIGLSIPAPGLAEEGMWLFNAVPKDKLKAQYGFLPTQDWLDHVRLSSVKFPGGSGSFVSPGGLVMTNHHIGAGCINAVSSAAKDYMKTGFYAPTPNEEVKCPNMTIQILQGVEDVTARVTAALKGIPASDAARQRTALTNLQNECGATPRVSCQAVPMYSGAMYFMYKYRSYNDVRLVFAPEYDAAFFGGDPDNFEYPRYDLDVTFLRVYEDNKPFHSEHYFSWSRNGARKNELVFVSGHPGSTQRLSTVAQLEFIRDIQYPIQIAGQVRTIADLLKRSSASEEERRRLERQLFSQQNSAKATKGYYSGLLDKELMAIKAKDENQLKAAFMKDQKLKAQYGDPWKAIADYYQVQREGNLYAARQYFPAPAGQTGSGGRGGQAAGGGRGGQAAPAAPGAFRGTLPDLAVQLVRAVFEKEKPESERSAAFRDAAVLEQRIFAADQKIDKAGDIASLSGTLTEMQKFLPGHPIVVAALNGRTPDEAARVIITGTKLEDIDFRRQLYAGGKEAITGSGDPLIVLVRAAEMEGRRLSEEWTKKVVPLEAARTAAETNIARIRFAVQGFSYPPDANGTLRLSYGSVKGYVEDGLGTAPKGTKLPPFTTFGQAYTYAEKHGNKDPYRLPESWLKAKPQVNSKTQLNFVSTNDIIGGNSGSPVLNKKAEVVGLIFDGNMQMLPGRFQFGEKMNRAVSVDSRAIVEAVRRIYHAAALADELAGVSAKAIGK